MNKFDNFIYYLRHQTQNSFTLSFAEIEDIIGSRLCNSAYKYKVYWSPSGRKAGFPTSVLGCGYRMDPDLINKRVTFYKI